MARFGLFFPPQKWKKGEETFKYLESITAISLFPPFLLFLLFFLFNNVFIYIIKLSSNRKGKKRTVSSFLYSGTMFDLQHTPVSITIERISELIDSVATQNTKTTGQITPFHSRAIPCIPIKDYLERVAKFVYLENDTLIAVLVYLDRISRAQPSLLPSPYNIHRLVITAIVVAHKFNSDIFFNNARYSKVSQKNIS